jgi:O-antigen/teichoic acid export membrane protein
MTYLRNLSLVFSGTVVAQALPVLGSLIITRLFLPIDFGVYSIWLGATVLLSICLTGRLETSLPMTGDGKNRAIAILFVLASTIISTLFIFLILALFFFMDIKSIGSISIKFLFFSLPASILMAFSTIWQNWAAAEGLLKKLSLIRIAQAGSVVIFQIYIGFFQPNVSGLIFGHIIGLAFSFLICILLMPINIHFSRIKFKDGILAFWKRNVKFLKFSLPADLINAVAGQLPLFLISSKFGADFTGYYALTARALGAPAGLLGVAVLDIFKRQAALAYK